MARSRLLLHEILEGLEGVTKAYFQAEENTSITYPCIEYHWSSTDVEYADNIKYVFMKGYTVTVIDRDPDSIIPAQVDSLPHTRFDRRYVADGLNHFVYQLFF